MTARAALVVTASIASCTTRGPVIERLDAPVSLPIEVLGAAEVSEAITLRLTPAQADAARGLRLRTHGLSTAGLATLGVNSAAALTLDDSLLAADEPARALGGVRGPLHSVWLDVPLAPGALRAGPNELRFGHRPADGSGVGYRVITMRVVNATGADVLESAAFASTDPTTWLAPADDSLRATGARLWASAAASCPGVGAQTRPSPGVACAGCHTADGRDLQAFAYSDRAIGAWAERCGLSQADGRAIAAYVRSLPVAPLGRPWNPPYQPGPGLDARPLAAWSAGAGLDAVLARDVDALATLAPGGRFQAALAPTGTLNLRELPIALLLPDWNHWLPVIHPTSAFGADFTASEVAERYQQLANDLAAGSLQADVGDLSSRFERFVSSFIGGFRTPERSVAAPIDTMAASQWLLVKVWDLLQRYDLERLGPASHGVTAEPRTWFGRFRPSPVDSTALGPMRPARTYRNVTWGYLNVLLNPGNRRHDRWDPVPWSDLLPSSATLAAEDAGAAVRSLALAIKGAQEVTNGIGPDRPTVGWSLDVADLTYLLTPAFEAAWSTLPPAERADLMDGFVAAWLTQARRFPPSQYARSDGSFFYAIPATYVPRPNQPQWPDRLMAGLPRLVRLGASADTVRAVADWAKTMWPLGDWESVRPDG